ncbi:MAG TPA: carboxypeptidase regulatory-like domain-containing protein [Terriglobales bacterium]|nr:carboxypeptidase regulatory-like domain-containing protein [Terriglobales bacterium]
MQKYFSIALASAVLAFSATIFAQDYQVISVTDGGTIKGTVKWSGPMPHLATAAITKDPKICDPNSEKNVSLDRLIVGPEEGVANTVVYLKNITRGKEMDLPEQRRFLDQKHCRYEPHILLVPVGATLKMRSSDATLHTVHMDGAATYNLPFPFPDQVVSRQMPALGLVNLKCNGGHTWMNAEMLVVAHPYYAVTDESGGFVLTNVPAGEYQLVAWHEGWNVAHNEGTFDVLTERRVERPVFGPPRTWEKSVKVSANSTATVNFTLSEK